MSVGAGTYTNALSGGLVVILLGVFLVVLGRLDLGRVGQSGNVKLLSRVMNPDEAGRLVEQLRQFNVVFIQVLGWIVVAAGCIGSIIGLVGMLSGWDGG